MAHTQWLGSIRSFLWIQRQKRCSYILPAWYTNNCWRTYEIGENEDGETVITFAFEDEKAEKYDGTFTFAEGTENGADYIKIGGVPYDKKD